MHHRLLLPPGLGRGDAIGIFTPSVPSHVRYPEKWAHGIAEIERLGYRVRLGRLTASGRSQGYRAGPPEERAAELMELVLDPEVRALLATVGGANSSSLIPWLDFDAIRAHPKILVGASDLTSLHLAFLVRAGLSTFYGPMAMSNFAEWPHVLPETERSFREAVAFDRAERRRLEPPPRFSRRAGDWATDWKGKRIFEPNPGWRCVRPGEARGPLLAAHTGTLLANAGTDVFPALDGWILLVEDLDAPISRLERNWRHLERLGVFDRIAGLIVGKPEDFRDEGAPFSLEDLLLEILGDRPIPVISEFDCSHTHPMLTLAQGAELHLQVAPGAVEVVAEGPWVLPRGGGGPGG